jgi:hypothetical protein
METTFFLHIDSHNLAHYYSRACLEPSKYLTNRKEDIQSKFNNVLLLSDKRFGKGIDCSLELVLTKKERENILQPTNKEDIFIFHNPLPITRIKRIFFLSENTKDKIITSINMGSGFIPKEFATTATDHSYVDYSDLKLSPNVNALEFSDQLRKYDSLLGGFALMRLSVENNMNYSLNYFSTLSYFNSTIEKEVGKINSIYWDAFEGKSRFKDIYPYINKQLTEKDIYDIAEKEKQEIKKSHLSGIIDLDSLDRMSYIIAVLYNYGIGDEGRKNKIDGLILNNFHKGLKPNNSEIISLCYGLNRGYSVFSNKYQDKIVKFELNSRVDYYTIESIYQFVFNNSKSSEFLYLDEWCPKFDNKETKLIKSNYRILDKIIIGERIEIGGQKWWSKIMSFFFQKENEELFKPILLKFYEIIKKDIDEENKDTLESKDKEISILRKENNELQAHNEQKNWECISLKKGLEAEKREYLSFVSDSEVSSYGNKYPNTECHPNYEKMFIEASQLIGDIGRKTKSEEVKQKIKIFYEKYPII